MIPVLPPYVMAVLSYNHPEITRQIVDSLYSFWLKLNVDPSERIFLIHNGSQSRSISELRLRFPKIHHLEIPENSGFSGGANFGLKKIFEIHPWIFFFTNDLLVESLPQTLPPQPGLYAPKIHFRKLGRIDSIGGRFEPLWGKISHLKNENEFKAAVLERKIYIPGTAFLISREVWTELKGFDESLHTYWEDVDFSFRGSKSGIHFGIVQNADLIHRVGKTCHKDSFYTLFLFQRNRRLVSLRHSPIKFWTQLVLFYDHSLRMLNYLKSMKWRQAKILASTYFKKMASSQDNDKSSPPTEPRRRFLARRCCLFARVHAFVGQNKS